MDVAVNLVLIVVFVLIGGFFAASEIALVSLHSGRVAAMAEAGVRGRRVAKLRADSNRFLSAVQIGVTFTGFFASSYCGATIAVRLEPVLAGLGPAHRGGHHGGPAPGHRRGVLPVAGHR